MESLKALLEEIGQRILQFLVDRGIDTLAKALGIERETLGFFVVIPILLVFLYSGIRKLRRRLCRFDETVPEGKD